MPPGGRSGGRPTPDTLAIAATLPAVPAVPMVPTTRSALTARASSGGGRCGDGVGLVDEQIMSPPWPFSSSRNEPVVTLSHEEKKEFLKLDEAVAMGAKAAKVVQTAGKALVRIRDGQLYRDAAASWEKYLDRHGLTARRANQMIAASAALEAVEAVAKETGTTVPDLTERAVRPLAGLPIEEAKAAIREASADGGLSPRSIAKAAGNRKAKGAKKMQIPRPVRLRLPGGTVIIEVNRKGVASGVTVEALLASALDSLRRQAAA